MRAREIFGLIVWLLLLGIADGIDAGTLPIWPGFLIAAACVAVIGCLALTGKQEDASRKGKAKQWTSEHRAPPRSARRFP